MNEEIKKIVDGLEITTVQWEEVSYPEPYFTDNRMKVLLKKTSLVPEADEPTFVEKK